MRTPRSARRSSIQPGCGMASGATHVSTPGSGSTPACGLPAPTATARGCSCVGEEAPIGGQRPDSGDQQRQRLRRPAGSSPRCREVSRQPRVEVVGPQRPGPAGHRVVRRPVEPHQASVGARAEALGVAAQLRTPVDAGHHVDADQRPTSRRLGQLEMAPKASSRGRSATGSGQSRSTRCSSAIAAADGSDQPSSWYSSSSSTSSAPTVTRTSAVVSSATDRPGSRDSGRRAPDAARCHGRCPPPQCRASPPRCRS